MSDRTLDQLLHAMTEGELTDTDRSALNAQLRDDPSRVDAYLDTLALHGLLRAEFGSEAAPLASPNHQAERARGPRHTWRLAAVAGIAAAVLIAATVAIYLATVAPIAPPAGSESQPLAKLIYAETSVSSDELGSLGTGDPIGSQWLRTADGAADIRFVNGTHVAVAGRTDLRIRTSTRVTMTRGRALFTCPHDVSGFTVELPDGARVVDLGTQFDVTVEGGRLSRIAVVDGKVELIVPGAAGQSVRRTIGADQMVEINGGAVRVIERRPGARVVSFNWQGYGGGPGVSGIKADTLAGYVPAGNWNNASAPGQPGGGRGAMSALADDAGAPTPIDVRWEGNANNFAADWTAPRSSGNAMLFNAYMRPLGEPTVVRISGVPFERYTVIAYVGLHVDDRSGVVTLDGDRRPVTVVDPGTWTRWLPVPDAGGPGNTALWADRSGDSFSITINGGLGLHGFQIVETSDLDPQP